MTLASIIIPVWNGITDLPECLAALATQSHTSLEIIAVDNASTDSSGDWIASHYPTVRLIRNAENLGFGGACNLGLQAATGDILILLNQDTIVRPDWLAALVKVLSESSDIGIAGSKALHADGTIQFAGAKVDERGVTTHVGYQEDDHGQYDRLTDELYVSGASLAIRRTLYEQIGGIDPGFYPAYFEDVDLCWRARIAGWRVVYAPTSVLIHKEQKRAMTSDYKGTYLYHKHRLRFVCKYWSVQELREKFIPAEMAWLTALKPDQERLIAAAHHAYLDQLLDLGDLSAWRQKLLGEAPGQIEHVAELLLMLRRFYPLHLLGIQENQPIFPLPQLHDAQRFAGIKSQQFRLDVPVIGGVVTALARLWYRLSADWYLKPIFHQQSQFNERMLSAATQNREQQEYLQFRMAASMLEYFKGHSSEMSDLAQEIDQLKRRVSELDRG